MRSISSVIALVLAAALTPVHAAPLPRLLGASVGSAGTAKADGVHVRTVQPDVTLVHRLARRHAEGMSMQRFVLDITDGHSLEAFVVDAELRATGATVFARMTDERLGSAVLTVEDGTLVVTLNAPSGNFQVMRRSDGRYDVTRQPSAQGRAPRAVTDAGAGDATKRSIPKSADVPVDSGRLIDMMIVWSPAAESAAGGAMAMQSQAQAAVDSLNAIFLNSGVANRVRLVHRQLVAYTERSNCAAGAIITDCALDDITSDNDGIVDQVHDLRDQHGADLVGFIIGNAPPWCGIAWIPSTLSSSNHPYGFAVVSQFCAVGGRGFAHEVAHNLGANHDAAYHGGEGPKPYNRGHLDPQGFWRTVMSYGGMCGNCTQIDYFSNPKLTHVDGDAVGTADANNALVINLFGKAAAAFRPTSPLHPVPQRFADVPPAHPFFGHIDFMAQAGITSGCTVGSYCPDTPVTRSQMAAFLERTMRASNWTAPPASGLFSDVPAGALFAGHIEKLYADGVTLGCASSPLAYCPDAPVTRGQMAAFLLRASCGASYTPAAPSAQLFADVPLSHAFAGFIHKLQSLGVTSGCATGPLRYCPDQAVTRAQMAAFIERSFPYRAPSEACSP